MTKVVDVLSGMVEDKFFIDDIDSIESKRFVEVCSKKDLIKILSQSKNGFPSMIIEKVDLYDTHNESTHAYGVTLINKDYWNIPIW